MPDDEGKDRAGRCAEKRQKRDKVFVVWEGFTVFFFLPPPPLFLGTCGFVGSCYVYERVGA